MSNLPKEIHNNTAVGGIVFEQTTFRDWCISSGLDPDRLNGYATLKKDYTIEELISIAKENTYPDVKHQ